MISRIGSIDDKTDYAHTCCVCGDGLFLGEGVECDNCGGHACKDHIKTMATINSRPWDYCLNCCQGCEGVA